MTTIEALSATSFFMLVVEGKNMITARHLFLPYRPMPDEPNYFMVMDLWLYSDDSIGFSGRLNKKGCGCEQECGKFGKQIAMCFDSKPSRLATESEYLAARQKTLASGIVLPLPNDFLPALVVSQKLRYGSRKC